MPEVSFNLNIMVGIDDISSSLCEVIDRQIKKSIAEIMTLHKNSTNNDTDGNVHSVNSARVIQNILLGGDLARHAQASEAHMENIRNMPTIQTASPENPMMGKPSYRHVVSPTEYDRDEQSPMVAQRKGDYISIKIDDSLVQRGVSQLQHTLIGRVSLAPGDKPYTLDDLKLKLDRIWGISGSWILIPLGKGFYNIQLPGNAERERILDKRFWNLKPGILRVQHWTPGFNPYKVNNSIAQVWIRIFELPMEYFQPQIIYAMASALGTVVKLDDRTKNRTMCHYARVLVDIDMTKGCEDYIMYESAG